MEIFSLDDSKKQSIVVLWFVFLKKYNGIRSQDKVLFIWGRLLIREGWQRNAVRAAIDLVGFFGVFWRRKPHWSVQPDRLRLYIHMCAHVTFGAGGHAQIFIDF